MKILSLHIGHNSTAVIADGGRILGALSQEKLDNVKNSAAFPQEAIVALCEEHGWRLDDIDEVVMASNVVYPPSAYEYLFTRSPTRAGGTYRLVDLAKRLERSPLGTVAGPLFRNLRRRRQVQLSNEGARFVSGELKAMGLGGKPLRHVEHHTCHARAAYHSLIDPQDEEPTLVFTADGSGDGLCATVTRVAGSRWERLAATSQESSLGGIYSNTTRFLGMKILEHEYKVMGLAPYAKKYYLDTYQRIFEPAIRLSPDGLAFESPRDTTQFYDYLVQHAVGERFDNLAAAAQHLVEERVVHWVRNAIRATGIRRIVTGGGLFMNVKLNRRLQELEEVERAHFMPSCGDESNPIGAAYAVAVEKRFATTRLDNLYLGISFDESALAPYAEKARVDNGATVSRPADIEAATAELLARGEVVARFSGRCEWGARSLGNRAILAHPSRMESFYTVNDLIKSRDFWMPFAPTVLDTAAAKYLEGYDPVRVPAPYMITAMAATQQGVKELRAALHQGDHTLRPQVLEESSNPKYYQLVKEFERITGIGAVLNTSFNLHGFPLVATPEQALKTFTDSGLKHLALGPFLLSKAS